MAWIKTLPDDTMRGEVVRSALASLADDQPELAADWLRQLPDGVSQREGLDLVLSLWAARDLSSAVTWFQTLPASPLRCPCCPRHGPPSIRRAQSVQRRA